MWPQHGLKGGIQSDKRKRAGECILPSVFLERGGRRRAHTVVCLYRPRPAFSAWRCWRFRLAGSVL